MTVQIEGNQGFAEMLKFAKGRLLARSFDEIAKNSGTVFYPEENRLRLKSLNQSYEIEPEGLRFAPEAAYWQHLIMLHYLDTADGTPVSGMLQSFGTLKDGLIRGTDFDRRAEKAIEALLNRYSPEEVENACKKLGAIFRESNADLCAEFSFLPRYPVTLKIWYADEEFPASGRLFADKSADHYLSIEDAVTAGEVLLEALRAALEFRK